MSLSTHKVEVVPIKLHSHPNADSLSIVYPFGEDGYTVVVRTEDWKDKELGAYIPPDNIVPDTPEYKFLDGHRRIKVKRFRGILSQGLMVPAPEGSKLGDDVAEQLGVTHYNPEEPVGSGAKAPVFKVRSTKPRSIRSWISYLIYKVRKYFGLGSNNPLSGKSIDIVTIGEYPIPKYDVDSLYRYPHTLQDGEEVIATEKIDGSNGRWVYIIDDDGQGRFYAGSHYEWKEEGSNAWWKMYSKYPDLKWFVQNHPGFVVYGEIYGPNVQKDMTYALPNGQINLAVFDIWYKGTYFDFNVFWELLDGYEIPVVPIRYSGPFNAKLLVEMATGLISWGGELASYDSKPQLAEGLVVKPIHERYERNCGRVILKIVSSKYMSIHDGHTAGNQVKTKADRIVKKVEDAIPSSVINP